MSKPSLFSTARSALLGACSVASLSLFAASAVAAPEPAQKVVSYADLDLAQAQDAAKLYSRLEHAAKDVCRTFAGSELSRKRMRQQCEAEALGAAVVDVDHASVSALHTSERRLRVAQRG